MGFLSILQILLYLILLTRSSILTKFTPAASTAGSLDVILKFDVITLRGGRIGEISNVISRRSIMKISNLHRFQRVRSRYSRDLVVTKTGKLLIACERWRPQHGSCDVVVFIRTEEHFPQKTAPKAFPYSGRV